MRERGDGGREHVCSGRREAEGTAHGEWGGRGRMGGRLSPGPWGPPRPRGYD